MGLRSLTAHSSHEAFVWIQSVPSLVYWFYLTLMNSKFWKTWKQNSKQRMLHQCVHLQAGTSSRDESVMNVRWAGVVGGQGFQKRSVNIRDVESSQVGFTIIPLDNLCPLKWNFISLGLHRTANTWQIHNCQSFLIQILTGSFYWRGEEDSFGVFLSDIS